MNITFHFLLTIILFALIIFIFLFKREQLDNKPNKLIVKILLKNTNRNESKELLQDYLYVFNSLKFYENFSKYKHLIYIDFALSYLVSCEFNFKDWSLVDHKNYTLLTFINATKDKAFELLIDVNNVKAIPCYYDNGSFEAKSIEEAIERTSKEYIEMLKQF